MKLIFHRHLKTNKLTILTAFILVVEAGLCWTQKSASYLQDDIADQHQPTDNHHDKHKLKLSAVNLPNDKLSIPHIQQAVNSVTFNTESVHFQDDEKKPSINQVINHNDQKKSLSSGGKRPNSVGVKKAIYDEKSLKDCETVLFDNDNLNNKVTVSDFGRMALTMKMHATFYSDMLIHRYDNYNDLKISGGPQVDQELCLKYLNELVNRSERLKEKRFDSMDLNMFRLMDTFGRTPAGLTLGNVYWTGEYHECLQLQIESENGKKLPTRYCLASLKHKAWPKEGGIDEFLSLKSAVCLPKVCDSINYKNKYDLVLNLIEQHASPLESNVSYISSLYCLPDKQSPLTLWWHSPKTAAFVGLLSIWLMILLYSTFRYSQLKKEKEEERKKRKIVKDEQEEFELGFGLTKGFETTKKQFVLSKNDDDNQKSSLADEKRDHDQEIAPLTASSRKYDNLKLYRALSITHNLSSLFNTSKTSSLMEAGEKFNSSSSSSSLNDKISCKPSALKEENAKNKLDKPIVDLRCIEGIKVIAMSYIIMGHVLMCATLLVENGRETAYSNSVTYAITNMMPAFAVNAFFTITGLLTAYLMFKQNQSHSFITSPIKWFAFIMYRYLRIMPLYLIVTMYTKHVARYTGSGPVWDYGTSNLAQRKACEQESLWWTVLFGANFKSPLEHCIPSAWYLANDFQFFIVTPIFLALLHKSPKLGIKMLKLCSAIGFVAGFMSIYYSSLDDMRPIAQFMPHGFKTYVSHLHENYVRPQYRIPAYLLGLLIGFSLHNYEKDTLKYLEKKKSNQTNNQQIETAFDSNNNQIGETQSEPESQQSNTSNKPSLTNSPDNIRLIDWSDNLKKYGIYWCIIGVVLSFIAPSIGFRIPMDKSTARFLVSLFMPTYHIIFSLSVGVYILLATTGHASPTINRFLSATFWKPLARLSLCAVLINVEVVCYLVQTKTHTQYLDNQYQAALNLITIVTTYLVSIVVCVLFEAPMRAGLNHLLAVATSKIAMNKKRKKSD